MESKDIEPFETVTYRVADRDISISKYGNPMGPPVVLLLMRGRTNYEHWTWLMNYLLDSGFLILGILLPPKAGGVNIGLDTPKDNAVTLLRTGLQVLGVGQAAFIGFDFGAAAALQFAIHEPHKVSRVIVFHAYYAERFAFEQISCPVLVLWVSPEQFHPRRHAMALAKRIPNAKLFIHNAKIFIAKNAKSFYAAYSEFLLPPVKEFIAPWKKQGAPAAAEASATVQQTHLATEYQDDASESKGEDAEIHRMGIQDPLAAFKAAIIQALERGLDIKSVFDTMDQDDDGSIDADDIMGALSNVDVSLDAEKAKQIVARLHPNEQGRVGFPEFELFAKSIQQPEAAPTDPRAIASRFFSALRTVCVAQGVNPRELLGGHDAVDAEAFRDLVSGIDSTQLLSPFLQQWLVLAAALGGTQDGAIPVDRLLQQFEAEAAGKPSKKKPVRRSAVGLSPKKSAHRLPGHGPAQAPALGRTPLSSAATAAAVAAAATAADEGEGKNEGGEEKEGGGVGGGAGTEATAEAVAPRMEEARMEDDVTAIETASAREVPHVAPSSPPPVLESEKDFVWNLSHDDLEAVMQRYAWLLQAVARARGMSLEEEIERLEVPGVEGESVVPAEAIAALCRRFGVHIRSFETLLFQRMFGATGSHVVKLDSLKDFLMTPVQQGGEAQRRFGRYVLKGKHVLPYLYDRVEIPAQYWLFQKIVQDLKAIDGPRVAENLMAFLEGQFDAEFRIQDVQAFLHREYGAVLRDQLAGEYSVLNIDVLAAIEDNSAKDNVSMAFMKQLFSSQRIDTPLDAITMSDEDDSNLRLLALDLRSPQSWLRVIDADDLEANNFPGICANADGKVISIDWCTMELKGVPKEQVGRLTSVRCLRLSNNNLSGILPQAIENLRFLEHLDMSYNNLQGDLPAWLTSLPHLRVCVLGNNRFTGHIPKGMFSEALEELDLSENALEGSIPASIGRCTNLTALWLNGNKLEGNVPSSIANCTKLKSLNLGDNAKLGGSLVFGSEFVPEYFAVHNSRITGDVQSIIGRPMDIRVLSIKNSFVFGTLPTKLCRLRIASIGGSKIKGQIPADTQMDPALHSLKQPEYYLRVKSASFEDGVFDASQDNRNLVEGLEGGIPPTLHGSPWKSILVRGNRWTHEATRERAALEELFHSTSGDGWSSRLGWTEMPKDLSTLHGVKVNLQGQVTAIRLPQNQLSTSKGLPDIFNRLPRLAVFDVSGNTLLQGAVPMSLLTSTSLQNLNLRGTRLTEWPAACVLSSPEYFSALRMYGGHPCNRVDLLAALAMYAGAGGAHSVWFRLSPEEWQPTEPLLLAEGGAADADSTDSSGSEDSGAAAAKRGAAVSWPGLFMECGRLTRVSLPPNAFSWGTGRFPPGIGQASALAVLNLHGVGLSGVQPLPDEVLGLQALEALYLHDNSIEGTIPTPLLFLRHLRHVHLDWKERGGLKLRPSKRELLQTHRWPQWVQTLDKAQYPTASAAVDVSYHMEDGIITLSIDKKELHRSVMNNNLRTQADLTFSPRLDPISRLFLVASAVLLVADMVTDIVVATDFAHSGDYGWLTIAVLCMALYALAASWYTASSLGSCSGHTACSALAAMVGLGGLTQVLQMMCMRPVTLSGRFHLTAPFKVTRYLGTLQFLEATLESLPQLVLQLYVRTVEGYSTVVWWEWLSLLVSFISVLRIIFMQDRQVQLSEGYEIVSKVDEHEDEGAVMEKMIQASTSQRQRRKMKKRRLVNNQSSKQLGSSFRSSLAQRIGKRATPTSTVIRMMNSSASSMDLSKIPSISVIGGFMLLFRAIEVLVAAIGTVMIGRAWKEYAFILGAGWMFTYIVVITITLVVSRRHQNRSQVLPLDDHDADGDAGEGDEDEDEGETRADANGEDGSNEEARAIMPLHSQLSSATVPNQLPIVFKTRFAMLLCTALSQSLLCWFFTTVPSLLLPRFLPYSGALTWRNSRAVSVLATAFIVCRYLFFIVLAWLWVDWTDMVISGVIVLTPVALIGTLVIAIIDCNVKCRRSCLLTGLWCDYDLVVNGQGKRDKPSEPKKAPTTRRRRRCTCRRRRPQQQKDQHIAAAGHQDIP